MPLRILITFAPKRAPWMGEVAGSERPVREQFLRRLKAGCKTDLKHTVGMSCGNDRRN